MCACDFTYPLSFLTAFSVHIVCLFVFLQLWEVLRRVNALSQSLRERAPLSQHHAFAVSPSRKSPGSETGARFHQAVACEYKIYVIKIYVCSFFVLFFTFVFDPAKQECSRPPFLKTKAVLAPCEMKSLLCSVFFGLKRNLNHPHLFQLIYGTSPSVFILVS